MTAPVQDVWARYMLDLFAAWLGDVTQLTGGVDLVDSANQAAANAATAYTLANNAQTSADGKNAVFYADAAHVPTATKTGDTWFETDVRTYKRAGSTYTATVIIGVFKWSGSSWDSQPVHSDTVAYIDAGIVTAGTLSAINVVGTYMETIAGVGTGASPSVSPGVLICASRTKPDGTAAPAAVGTQGGIYAYNNTGPTVIIDGATGTFQFGTGSNVITYSGGVLSVTGGITATSGSIGGFSINSNNLQAGGGASTVGMHSGSGFWAGAASPSTSAPFYVSIAGALYCTSATITTPTITGGTLTGVTYASASSGARLTIGTGGVAVVDFYNSGGTHVGAVTSSSTLPVVPYITFNGTDVVIGAGNLSMTAGSQMACDPALTTTNAANANINSVSGLLWRSTSNSRYKLDVRPLPDPHRLLQVAPKVWHDKGAVDRGERDAQDWIPGFLAEDVDAAGLTELVTYAADGTPDALAYDRFCAPLVALVAELFTRVERLETRG